MYIHAHCNFDFFIDFNDIFNRLKHIDLFFRFPKEKLWEKYNNKYKIIPVGNFCLPRVIATFNNLKPRKKDGEKTCPFDQAFFDKIEHNAALIENEFYDFFDDLEYSQKENMYYIRKHNVWLNHEAHLNVEELKNTYKRRIDNFYNYINSKDTYKFFLMAICDYPHNKNISKLLNALEKYVDKNNYSLIIINLNPKIAKLRLKNTYIINCNSKKTLPGDWCPKLVEFKTLRARFLNHKIASNLIEIIKTNKHKFPV